MVLSAEAVANLVESGEKDTLQQSKIQIRNDIKPAEARTSTNNDEHNYKGDKFLITCEHYL